MADNTGLDIKNEIFALLESINASYDIKDGIVTVTTVDGDVWDFTEPKCQAQNLNQNDVLHLACDICPDCDGTVDGVFDDGSDGEVQRFTCRHCRKKFVINLHNGTAVRNA